jgi:hypothetical protein
MLLARSSPALPTRLLVPFSQVSLTFSSLALAMSFLVAYQRCSAGSEKSTTQKLGDSGRGNADDAQANGASYIDSAKQTVGDAANAASETLSNAGKIHILNITIRQALTLSS